jgi:hypothetical protein
MGRCILVLVGGFYAPKDVRSLVDSGCGQGLSVLRTLRVPIFFNRKQMIHAICETLRSQVLCVFFGVMSGTGLMGDLKQSLLIYWILNALLLHTAKFHYS